MKEIRLTRTQDCWMAAHWEDGQPDEAVVQAFGTHAIPTAFTAHASSGIVLREIQKRNPQAYVSVE